MVGVIVGSKKTGINPDNVATPIAASFGDLITLAILAWISQGLYDCLGEYYFFGKNTMLNNLLPLTYPNIFPLLPIMQGIVLFCLKAKNSLRIF